MRDDGVDCMQSGSEETTAPPIADLLVRSMLKGHCLLARCVHILFFSDKVAFGQSVSQCKSQSESSSKHKMECCSPNLLVTGAMFEPARSGHLRTEE